ncbi:MAG: methyltransferase domain-containing protein, partial [bacterium]|nr:methyltransferase domain-containing protein [bacterium]
LSDDKKVLRNIYSSLKPGGHFVIDIMGKEVLARIFLKSSVWFEEDDKFIMVEAREIKDDWSWIKNRWILIENGKVKAYNVDHRLYSATELKWLLQEAGFNIKKIYGEMNVNSSYDNNAKRLIIHAVKPGKKKK